MAASKPHDSRFAFLRSWPVAVSLLLAASLIAFTLFHAHRYFWDFFLYYHAGLAANRGFDPYLPAGLAAVIGHQINFVTSYPWAALIPYRLLALLPYPAALGVFSVAKLFALAGILWSWRRLFPRIVRSPDLPLVLFLAFNASLIRDLRGGNVALFETLLLSLAFAAFAARRFGAFSLLVAGAGLFKIAPLFFLVLLFAVDDRQRLRHLAPAGAAFALLFLAPLAFAPEFVTGFVRNAVAIVDERGVIAPALLPLLRDIGKPFGLMPPLPDYAWLALAAGLFLASALAVLRHRPVSPAPLITLACFTYALIHPRFKDYAGVLLIGPALFLVDTWRPRPALYALAVALLILPLGPSVYTGAATPWDFLREYYAWFLGAAGWGIALRRISAPDGTASASRSSP